MQQQQRWFAEAAVAPQTTVWDQLSELVTSDEGKRELATLRSAYVDITQKLNKMAAVSPSRRLPLQPASPAKRRLRLPRE